MSAKSKTTKAKLNPMTAPMTNKQARAIIKAATYLSNAAMDGGPVGDTRDACIRAAREKFKAEMEKVFPGWCANYQ